MSTLKKIAVLTMLVVSLIAFNIPASFAANVGTVGAGAGISAAASSTLSATSISSATTTGFGAFGGFGFPFNWGFSPFGVGAFPFNWGIGGGFSPFGLLGWNHFSPGFGCGFPFSPGFLGCCQPLPFILGSELGGSPILGWDMSPWAFGVQSCVKSLPVYFGAHGFGFPFSIGNFRIGLTPSVI